MKEHTAGTIDQRNLNEAALPGGVVDVDKTNDFWADSGVAHRIQLVVKLGDSNALAGTGNITFTPRIGDSTGAARNLMSHQETIAVISTKLTWESKPITLTAVQDTVKLVIHSDNAADTGVDVQVYIMECGSALTDSNGRTDVGLVGGATPLSGTGWAAKLVQYLKTKVG